MSTYATERLGVAAVTREFSRWGWAFREQFNADFGIDAHVEPCSGTAHSGRLIALQIKSGPSYFGEEREAGWVYRGDDKHLLYWLRHCLPVILILHDPRTGLTYWAHITPDSTEFTDAGWTMIVPSSQVLDEDAAERLAEIAESAPGASDDPVEASCAYLPPTTALVVRAAQPVSQGGAMRLAALLAAGRSAPRLAVEAVLSGEPSWLPEGKGQFEIAVATYATEHGHPDLAADAFARAALYPDQPADILRGYAAMSAAESGDETRARELMAMVEADPSSSLLLATADAVVGHLGKPGPVPIPVAVAAATPAARAAEPTCLAFLGVQALRRQEAMAAVGYFEEAHAVHPEGSTVMLQLAQALQLRVGIGLSAVSAEDLRRIEELAGRVLGQRRRWSGPSEQALAMLVRRHAQVGAFEEAVRLATPAPDGGAQEREAAADEIVILGVQAAQILGDDEQVARFASRAVSDHAKAVVAALTADPELADEEQAVLWQSVLSAGAMPTIQLLAWHRLACLGVWPLPDVEELRAAGEMDDMPYDVLQARAMIASGDVGRAVTFLRGRASTSPMAAEALVDLLQEEERFDEAMDEAARGHERFGDAVLAHKRLNLLVMSGRPDDAADEAVHLLARPDTAPELRIRTYRRLIAHFAYRGEWPAVEQHSRAARTEFPDEPDLPWNMIVAAHNQGRPDRAQAYYLQFQPEIVTVPHAGMWLALHMRNGFTQDDVAVALDLLERWPEDTNFEAQVLSALLEAAGRRTPSGELVLPELDDALTLDRFQSRVRMFTSRNPDGPFRVITAEPQDLADMLRAQLAPYAEQVNMMLDHIRDGRLWLGALAGVLGRSYAEALISRVAGVLVAVAADPPLFMPELDAARAALDHPVVIESSAVVVATIIPGRWPQLRGAFTELTASADAWNDFQMARANLLRDPETSFSVGYDPHRDVLTHQRTSQEDHEYLKGRFAAIDKALEDLTVIRTPALGKFRELAAVDTDAALSPLALAAETGKPLWSDDFVLRLIAREHGIPVFGTVALLDALIETERMEDTLRDDVAHLARGYVADLLLTTDELLSLIAENDYQIGPATIPVMRPLFWADPVTGQEILLELITKIHDRAPQTTLAWFRAACNGLAARRPGETITEHARGLAEAVCSGIHADGGLRDQILGIGDEAGRYAV